MSRNKNVFLILMIITALAFTGCGIVRKNPEAVKKSVVARVNGQEIKREEFTEKLELYKTSLESQYGKDVWNQDIQGKKFIDVVKEQVIERMIMDMLILEAAEGQGILVSPEEVDEEIQECKE